MTEDELWSGRQIQDHFPTVEDKGIRMLKCSLLTKLQEKILFFEHR
jgi:hypothetical protein